jgi:hypothetical protein
LKFKELRELERNLDQINTKLEMYARANRNVMLIGTHGIGKTERVMQVCKKIGITMEYFSTPTLDPYIDVIGLPVPNKEEKVVEFYRKVSMSNAELLMFDELNRAHPKVLNAILELVQFKSVNGSRLPNLKMVWCAINPPGGQYQVEELDPALVDRFQCYMKLEAQPSLEYLKTKMNHEVAKAVYEWYSYDCGPEHRTKITPRRLEYIGLMINDNLPWHDAIPLGAESMPLQSLDLKISKIGKVAEKEIIPTKEFILANIPFVLTQLEKDPHVAIRIKGAISDLLWQEIFACRDIIERMPKDLLDQCLAGKMLILRKSLKVAFIKNKVELDKYPKLAAVMKLHDPDLID